MRATSTATIFGDTARRGAKFRQGVLQARASGCSPWLTCSARTRRRERGARTNAASNAVESTPPLKATHTATFGNAGKSAARCARSHRGPKDAAFIRLSRGRFGIHTECGNLGAARRPEVLGAHLLQRRKMAHESGLEILRHCRRVAMRTTEGFLQHLVDEPKLRQARRSKTHRIRGRLFSLSALP